MSDLQISREASQYLKSLLVKFLSVSISQQRNSISSPLSSFLTSSPAHLGAYPNMVRTCGGLSIIKPRAVQNVWGWFEVGVVQAESGVLVLTGAGVVLTGVYITVRDFLFTLYIEFLGLIVCVICQHKPTMTFYRHSGKGVFSRIFCRASCKDSGDLLFSSLKSGTESVVNGIVICGF